MAAGEDRIHDIVGRLGQLEGTIKTFMSQWAGQDQAAQSGRRVVYERLELLSSQINRVATDVQAMQQDVAEMRNDIDEKITPHIEDYRASKERKLGAKAVWALIGGVIIAIASAMAYIGDKVVSYFIAKP